MPRTTLRILDQCNVRFLELDPSVRRKMHDALKFTVPGAKFMPAVKLGRWDGTVSFCTIAGATFYNLLDRVLPIVLADGYDIEIDDRRPTHQFDFPEITDTIFSEKCWPQGHPAAGEPIILRDYQVEAIQKFITNMQGVQQLPTASGKTILVAALSGLVERYGRSLVIVPSKNLVTQTEEDYRNLSLDVGVYFGDRKETGHTHTIVTWQSLASLEEQNLLTDFIEGVVCLINDEVHSVRGKVLKDLLTGPLAHVPIRWGLTGTVPKEDHEALSLLAAIGPVIGTIHAADLQEREVLANCYIEIIQLQDDHVLFPSYDSEHDFLVTDLSRLRHIAKLLKTWVASGNMLILVDRIETGERLTELLPDAVFISGSMKIAKRQIEYKAVQTEDHKIIVATYGVAAVGINVPRIFNLVLLEAGQSFIRTWQSVGRGLRRAKDKDHIRVVDLCSSLKYSKRHLSKRKTFYNEAHYPHHTTKVYYR